MERLEREFWIICKRVTNLFGLRITGGLENDNSSSFCASEFGMDDCTGEELLLLSIISDCSVSFCVISGRWAVFVEVRPSAKRGSYESSSPAIRRGISFPEQINLEEAIK